MVHITKITTRAGKRAYAVRWDEDGKVKQKQFPYASDARSFASRKDIEAADERKWGYFSLKHGKHGPAFSELAQEWLELKEKPTDGSEPLEPSTLRAYRRYLGNVSVLIGDRTASQIQTQEFELIHAERRAAGNASSTIKLHLTLTSNVLEYARACRIITEVPMHDIKVAQGRRERIAKRKEEDEKPYSPDEIYTMLAAANSLAKDRNRGIAKAWKRYRPMIYFLVYTGARISEARAWRWQDYLEKERRVRIHQKAGDGVDIGDVKSVGAVRKLPLHTPLKEALDGMDRHDSDGLVFATSRGTPVSYANLLRRMLAPLKDRADVLAEHGEDPRYVKVSRDRAFHAFRHFYASNLVRKGANLKQLQTYCGHSSPAFTLRVYGHLFDDDADALIDQFDV